MVWNVPDPSPAPNKNVGHWRNRTVDVIQYCYIQIFSGFSAQLSLFDCNHINSNAAGLFWMPAQIPLIYLQKSNLCRKEFLEEDICSSQRSCTIIFTMKAKI
ncbi:hypothetical protein AMECASPLE_001725 [Ameca splendens]|uniref:Uncharacterized protein n=1 Tax=Ameca splendens TaxID=208324 RepID=A0ABV0XB33_9TELE